MTPAFDWSILPSDLSSHSGVILRICTDIFEVNDWLVNSRRCLTHSVQSPLRAVNNILCMFLGTRPFSEGRWFGGKAFSARGGITSAPYSDVPSIRGVRSRKGAITFLTGALSGDSQRPQFCRPDCFFACLRSSRYVRAPGRMGLGPFRFQARCLLSYDNFWEHLLVQRSCT